MKLRLPYWFHYKAWTLKDGRPRRGLWAAIRKLEGRYYP